MSAAFTSLSKAMAKGFFRDKATLFFSFIFPLMFLVIFGLLFRDAGAEKIKIGAVGDGPVLAALEQTGAVELERFDSVEAGVRKVRDGDLPGLVEATGDTVRLSFAASDQAQAGTVRGLVAGVTQELNVRASGQPPRFAFEAAQVEDASLQPIQYLTPGIMSWGIAVTAVFGAALTMVNWRRKQVLRRLRLAPITPTTVLSSRLTVTVGVAFVQALVFVGVALLPIFGLRLSGTWWLSIPVFVLGVLAFFAIGMLIGAFCKTEEAATGAANIVVLPMAFLSGTFFPIEAAPPWLQTVSKVFPLRHMNDGMMDFLVRGKDFSALLVPCAVLIGFTLVVGFVASRVFTWEDS
ncbi:ABC-2 type transport system permease protein [Actinokineospora alba]|uniref:Transport permease protein n=1 Tax=Actinokineospora alba TaxID=504798 RepID=A0A1H0HQ11_9PSEU|nr:ABC transporter permease [Actinokineospora alba]TDP64799.1 ABC-2 type transport system permease protein [Actinokineospora alba]SDH46259.1 ABC-2 type transport system permease protein [Actinokineospora alba]SDO21208.1 ABC-2 type transport system permease protein [Actinokineospora alba]